MRQLRLYNHQRTGMCHDWQVARTGSWQHAQLLVERTAVASTVSSFFFQLRFIDVSPQISLLLTVQRTWLLSQRQLRQFLREIWTTRNSQTMLMITIVLSQILSLLAVCSYRNVNSGTKCSWSNHAVHNNIHCWGRQDRQASWVDPLG